MSESKRGVVMLIQAGDPEITGAIAEGIMAARGTDTSSGADAPPSPQGEGFGRAEALTREQIETVAAEMDRMSILEGLRAQAQGKAQDAPETRAQGDSRRAWGAQEIERAMLRVAVGNSKTAEDYAMMRFEADMEYGESLYEPGWWDKIADKALGLYGLFVCAVSGAFKAQDRVLEKRL